MMHFKLCLRCNGDVILKQDTYGSFYQCLHCGNIMELDFVHTLVKANAELQENKSTAPVSTDLVNQTEMILY